MVGIECFNDIHPADRSVLGTVDDVFPGRHHLLQDASEKTGQERKFMSALAMAALFALVESFLAGTENHSFIWVYKWWGVLPVFITTYIPFFLASNFVPYWKKKDQIRFLSIVWGAVAVLLVTLIPLGII